MVLSGSVVAAELVSLTVDSAADYQTVVRLKLTTLDMLPARVDILALRFPFFACKP